MKAWFISDVHLKTPHDVQGEFLLVFLRSLAQGEKEVSHLFLLGDIFDFWAGDHLFYYRKFQNIVETLVQLKRQGVRVVYIEGNHDVHVRSFWQKWGIECFVEDQYFQVGPWVVRVSHGDLMNPMDTKYIKYRNFVRHPLMEKIVQLFPASLFHRIGERASRFSRKKSKVQRQVNEDFLRTAMRTYAYQSFSERAYDYFIAGHIHIQDEYHFSASSTSAISINLGCWFDGAKAFWLDSQGHGWEMF